MRLPEGVRLYYPKIVTPVDVAIVDQTEYPSVVWADVVVTVRDAEAEAMKAREVKLRAEAAYRDAMAQRDVVQAVRDRMIATDKRTPSELGEIVGVLRSRCSQLRKAMRLRMGLPVEAQCPATWTRQAMRAREDPSE